MATRPDPQMMTVEEYFELERSNSDLCYEYVDGHIYLMAGGSLNHDTIKSNIQGLIWNHLRGKPCRIYSSDAKVRVNKQRYFHPDLTITCDPQDRGTIDFVLSPRLIFEVLSPGTEIKDRTWKLQHYLSVSTLEEYVLVDSHTIKMEMYRREGQKWVYYIFEPGDELELASLQYSFPITEAYLDVDFEEQEERGEG